MRRKPLILSGTVAIGVILVLLLLSHSAEPLGTQLRNPRSASMEVELGADSQIKNTVHRACYDCHSDQPRDPWYGHVWPASHLVRSDQRIGTARLNFSEWDRLSPEMSKIRLMDACTTMREDRMPLWYYRPFHPDAHLSEQEVQHFCAWAQAQ